MPSVLDVGMTHSGVVWGRSQVRMDGVGEKWTITRICTHWPQAVPRCWENWFETSRLCTPFNSRGTERKRWETVGKSFDGFYCPTSTLSKQHTHKPL